MVGASAAMAPIDPHREIDDGEPTALCDRQGRHGTVRAGLGLGAAGLVPRRLDVQFEHLGSQIVALNAKGYRCVAPDRRGHGRSDMPATGYDLDTLTDDVAAVIEQRDLRDVTIVAHSMGSIEAVNYLARHGAGAWRGWCWWHRPRRIWSSPTIIQMRCRER